MPDDDGMVTSQDVAALGNAVADLRMAVDREAEARVREQELLANKQLTAARAIELAEQSIRRNRWLAIGGVMALAVGVLVVLSLVLRVQHEVDTREEQRRDAAVVSCLNANQSRAAIEERFEQFTTLLGNVNAPTDPTAKAARDAFIAQFIDQLRASVPPSLQPRDCSPEAATQPTLVTVPPPTG